MGYDDFRKARVMMAKELQKRGWELYGWKDDDSNLMIDYYSPANWNGIATKAGYVVVVDDSSAYYSGRDITKYTSSPENQKTITKLTEKILKLRRMTVVNNASVSEEITAKSKIETLELELKNLKSTTELSVVGQYPKYQPNPRGSKWHVEKDEVIYAKGTGIGKFADVYYFNPEEPMLTPDRECYSNEESYQKALEYAKQRYQNSQKIYKSFQTCIQKIDAAAGGTIGKGELEKYKPVTKTKKVITKETKDVPMPQQLREGMYFQLKRSFSRGCYKGMVYKIEFLNKDFMRAFRMDKKLNKTLTGMSNSSNFFCVNPTKFESWVNRGFISMVKIQEKVSEEEYQTFVKV